MDMMMINTMDAVRTIIDCLCVCDIFTPAPPSKTDCFAVE